MCPAAIRPHFGVFAPTTYDLAAAIGSDFVTPRAAPSARAAIDAFRPSSIAGAVSFAIALQQRERHITAAEVRTRDLAIDTLAEEASDAIEARQRFEANVILAWPTDEPRALTPAERCELCRLDDRVATALRELQTAIAAQRNAD